MSQPIRGLDESDAGAGFGPGKPGAIGGLDEADVLAQKGLQAGTYVPVVVRGIPFTRDIGPM
jgi:hypothetical protein